MPQYILAIDTSCDETAVAVVDGQRVLSNVVASQAQLHKQYGGVFPTVAKQAHQENIAPAVAEALRRAGKRWQDIRAIGVTQGPGLAPALEIGLRYAQELGRQYDTPVVPVNHIEGHALSVLAQPMAHTTQSRQSRSITPQFPALSLVISGGHTEFILVKKIGQYEKLGWTIDDAAGECLDKVGRLLGLGYPAGPVVEKLAKTGNPAAFPFPLPMTTSKDFNMSFSGLKTHSKKIIAQLEAAGKLNKSIIADFCASLQEGVFAHILYKLEKLLATTEVHELWLGGGVAANLTLRKKLRSVARAHNLTFRTPYTQKLCGDNAAMIGLASAAFLERNPDFTSAPLDRKPQWSIA